MESNEFTRSSPMYKCLQNIWNWNIYAKCEFFDLIAVYTRNFRCFYGRLFVQNHPFCIEASDTKNIIHTFICLPKRNAAITIIILIFLFGQFYLLFNGFHYIHFKFNHILTF